jgi:hypothetical protein
MAAATVALLVVAGAVVATKDGGLAPSADDEVANFAPSSPGGAAVGEVTDGAPPVSIPGARSGAGAGRAGGAIDPAGPKIVRTGELSVQVPKGAFGSAFDRVSAIAVVHGGYVTSSSTTISGEDRKARSGEITLRVPSDRFDDARRALGELGEVQQESSRGEDVSGQLVDYDARLRSLQAQEEALRGLLGKATTVGEVLQVQNSLFDVRQQVEQLTAQRDQLAQQAALSTLQLSLYEPGAVLAGPDPEPVADNALVRSVREAVDGAVAVVGGMIVVVGWLLPVAILAGLGWGVVRLRRRGGAGTPQAPAPVAP